MMKLKNKFNWENKDKIWHKNKISNDEMEQKINKNRIQYKINNN
jgi:hypothetical protein